MTTIKDVLTFASMFDRCAIDNVPYSFNEEHSICDKAIGLCPPRGKTTLGLYFTNGVCTNFLRESEYSKLKGQLFGFECVVDFLDIPEFIASIHDLDEDAELKHLI